MNITFNAITKEVFLYNSTKVSIFVDKQILNLYQNEGFVITLVHKTKYRNKLRRVVYTDTSEVLPVVNGVPGPLSVFDSGIYQGFKFEIPDSIQGPDWIGYWDVYFSSGDLISSPFTLKLQRILFFREPTLPIIYNDSLDLFIRKEDLSILVGGLFILDSSVLDGFDILLVGGLFILDSSVLDGNSFLS